MEELMGQLGVLVNVPFIGAMIGIIQLIKKVVGEPKDEEKKKKKKKFWILLVLLMGFPMAAIANFVTGWEGINISAKIASFFIKGVIYACVASYFYGTKNFFPDKKEE